MKPGEYKEIIPGQENVNLNEGNTSAAFESIMSFLTGTGGGTMGGQIGDLMGSEKRMTDLNFLLKDVLPGLGSATGGLMSDSSGVIGDRVDEALKRVGAQYGNANLGYSGSAIEASADVAGKLGRDTEMQLQLARLGMIPGMFGQIAGGEQAKTQAAIQGLYGMGQAGMGTLGTLGAPQYGPAMTDPTMAYEQGDFEKIFGTLIPAITGIVGAGASLIPGIGSLLGPAISGVGSGIGGIAGAASPGYMSTPPPILGGNTSSRFAGGFGSGSSDYTNYDLWSNLFGGS